MSGEIKTRAPQRFIHVGVDDGSYVAIPVSEAAAQKLLAADCVYDCGDGHDLHLKPDHLWAVEDVEMVLTAIADICGPVHAAHSAITITQELTDDQITALRRSFEESYQGRNPARAPVLDDSPLVQAVRGINFEGLRIANLSRCRRWHNGGVADWTPERWFTATAGELGEAGNALKKLFRVQDDIANKNAPDRDIQSREQAIEKIADEIGDTLIYLDLFAASLGIDMEDAARRVFNRTSEKCGFPERIGEHSVYLAAPEAKGGGA